jgi:hypothetical protein
MFWDNDDADFAAAMPEWNELCRRVWCGEVEKPQLNFLLWLAHRQGQG